MALNQQRTSIPFVGGQEQQIAKELVDPPLLLKAHNVVPRRNGGLAKRPGWISEDFSVEGYPYLPQPERIARRGDEILWIGETRITLTADHLPPTLIARAPGESTEYLVEPPVWIAKGAVPRFNVRKLLELTHSNIGRRIRAWDCAFAGDSESGVCQNGVVCMVWRTINSSEADATVQYAVVDVATKSILGQATLSIEAYNESLVRVCALKNSGGDWYFHIFYLSHVSMGICNVEHVSIHAATPWDRTDLDPLVTSVTGFDAYTSDPDAEEHRLYTVHSKDGETKLHLTMYTGTSGSGLYEYSSSTMNLSAVVSSTVIYWTPTIVCDPDGTEIAVHFGVMAPGCVGTPSNVLANWYADPYPDHMLTAVSDVVASGTPDITRDHDGGQQIAWAGDKYLGAAFRRDNWWISWERIPDEGIGIRFQLYYAQADHVLTKQVPIGATMTVRPWGRPFNYRGQAYFPVIRGNQDATTGIEIIAPYRAGITGGDPVSSYRVAGRFARGEIEFSGFTGETGVPLCRGRNSIVESYYQRGRFFAAFPVIALDGTESRMALFDIDARDPQRFAWCEAAGDTYVASSVPWMYDGGTGHEIGFPCKPQSLSGEIALSEVDAPSGGFGTAGHVYYVKAHWEGLDSMGRVVRSGVSTADPITISAPLKTIAVTFINLCVTTHSNVRLVVYTSEDQGITYVRSSQIIHNSWYATSQTTVVLDPRRAFQLGAPTIYTDRLLPADPPIPAQLICEWQRRIWLVNGRDVSPSNEIVDGEEPQFSDELRFQLARDATGIAPYDDRLVIWTKDAVYWLSGDGPNDLGVDGSFTQPQRLQTDFGCIDARSIIRTEKGICFQSVRGIELLDRGLGTGVISDGVAKTILDDGYTEIVGASWDQQMQICRFVAHNPSTNAFIILCWHTLYGWWTTASVPGMGRPNYTDQPNGIIRACDGNWMALGDRELRDSSPVCKLAKETGPVGATYIDRTATGYTGSDANHWYQAEIETANVKLDGLLGFVRVWNAEVLTSELGVFTGISIACVSDYADTESTTARIWGSASEVASATINSTHHAFRVHVKDQQVQSIRLKIKDVRFADAGTTTETFLNFVGFSLQWGQQPGAGRRAEGAKK